MTRIVVRLMQAAMLLVAAANAVAQTAPATTAASQADKPAPGAESQQARQLKVSGKVWTGDFDKMLERRIIRVAIPYSRSLYFVDKGRERGLNAELVRDVERWLNTKYAKQLGKRPLTMYIVATTRDKLLTDVRDGLADIAVGNLTVTEERLKLVDFVAPDEKVVNIEILVTGPTSPAIASLDDLAGKTVHVRKASSYYESLTALNDRFTKEGKAPVKLVFVPDALEDEDMLEMMNAGLLAGDGRRRLEGEDVGAGAAEDQGQREHRAARAHEEGLGDPQGQSQARSRSSKMSTRPRRRRRA